MATTTNYGWETPDDTDLVKDGALASRTLGSSIDTTVKNLNPETTLGDIAYRSSTANVKTRLALGTAGQILAVNSGATAPEWVTSSSGGMTLLSTTTLSGASTTVSGISGAYDNLYVEVEGATWNTAASRVQIEFNSAAIGFYCRLVASSGADMTGGATLNVNNNSQDWNRTDGDNFVDFIVFNYAATDSYKGFSLNAIYKDDGGSNIQYTNFFGGLGSNSAITSITIKAQTNTLTGGTIKIYGVK